MELPIPGVSKTQITAGNKGTSPGMDQGKEAAPGSRLLAAAAAASVLSLHLPTKTQMCGCICTEKMNNNSRGEKGVGERARGEGSFHIPGGEEQDQQGDSNTVMPGRK